MTQHLQATLTANPNHAGARLLMADRLIDREAYDEAETQLSKVLAVNPIIPRPGPIARHRPSPRRHYR